jgi:hypothetical protein
MSLCKTKCQVPIVTKQTNNISKKMFQAQMIRTNGRYAYKYSNSKTDTIHQIIISQIYAPNKSLLFDIGIKAYTYYYRPLAVQYNLTNIAETILQNLTPEESAILYCSKPPIVIAPVLPTIPLEGLTYYVVSVKAKTFPDLEWSYFVFKNYSSEDFIIPSYTFTFDMSHPSNAGTRLAFSFYQGGEEIDYIDYSTPNLVKITLPKDVTYTDLYPYNANEENLYLRYNKSAYTIGSFTIKLSSFALPINKNVCTPVFNPVDTPSVVVYNSVTYELLYLTASSLVYVYEFGGTNLTIKDIKSTENLRYLSKRKFGLSNHTYKIYVPQTYALAVLNSGQETNIQYSGDPNKATKNILVVGTEADDIYDFYYGTITITVTGSFQPISLYTLGYGYLNAKQMLVYAENPDTYFDLNPYVFPF